MKFKNIPNGIMVQLKASSEVIIIFFSGITEDGWKGFKQKFVAARNGCQKKEGNQNRPLFSDNSWV